MISAMIRDIFFRDLGWKLFSVLLAVLIWLTVHRILEERNTAAPVTYGSVPILIVASASDVHFYRVAPANVDVTVSGTPEAMALLRTNQIHAVVDLSDPSLPTDIKRPVDVSVPAGITVLDVDPPLVGVIRPPTGNPSALAPAK